MKYIKGVLAIFFIILFLIVSVISYVLVSLDQVIGKIIRGLITSSR